MPSTTALRAVPRDPGPAPAPRHLRAVPPPPPALSLVEREIPSPEPSLVRALAVQGYEVLAGIRNVNQLGPLITVPLARTLVTMRAVWRDRRIVCRDERVRNPRAVRVRIDQSGPAVAEAAVVLDTGAGVHAVAIRLEWAHRHWRASDLVVL